MGKCFSRSPVSIVVSTFWTTAAVTVLLWDDVDISFHHLIMKDSTTSTKYGGSIDTGGGIGCSSTTTTGVSMTTTTIQVPIERRTSHMRHQFTLYQFGQLAHLKTIVQQYLSQQPNGHQQPSPGVSAENEDCVVHTTETTNVLASTHSSQPSPMSFLLPNDSQDDMHGPSSENEKISANNNANLESKELATTPAIPTEADADAAEIISEQSHELLATSTTIDTTTNHATTIGTTTTANTTTDATLNPETELEHARQILNQYVARMRNVMATTQTSNGSPGTSRHHHHSVVETHQQHQQPVGVHHANDRGAQQPAGRHQRLLPTSTLVIPDKDTPPSKKQKTLIIQSIN
jgi:hypothetical protein